jgi:hypothetical protein
MRHGSLLYGAGIGAGGRALTLLTELGIAPVAKPAP